MQCRSWHGKVVELLGTVSGTRLLFGLAVCIHVELLNLALLADKSEKRRGKLDETSDSDPLGGSLPRF